MTSFQRSMILGLHGNAELAGNGLLRNHSEPKSTVVLRYKKKVKFLKKKTLQEARAVRHGAVFD